MNILQFSYITKTTNLYYYDVTVFYFLFVAKIISLYRNEVTQNVTNEVPNDPDPEKENLKLYTKTYYIQKHTRITAVGSKLL